MKKNKKMAFSFRKQLLCSLATVLLLLGLVGGNIPPEPEPEPEPGIETLGFSGPGTGETDLKPNPTDSDGGID